MISFLTDLVKRYSAAIREQTSARDRLRRIVRASLEAADAHPYATEIYQNEFANLAALPDYTEISAAVEASHDVWYRVVENGVGNGEFNSGIDSFEFQRMMRECVFMSVRWRRETLSEDIDTLITTLTCVFFDGFAPAPVSGESAPKRAPTKPTPVAKSKSAPAVDRKIEVDDSSVIRAELDSLRNEMQAIREALTKRPRQS